MQNDNNASQPSVQYITIDDDMAGQRIDNFLITKLKGVPKTRIYRILRKGEVRVNKKRVDPSYRLQSKDEVRIPPVRLAEKKQTQLNPKTGLFLQNRIIYEDKGLLIINKPPGMPVHGGTGVSMGVIEALKAFYPKLPHLELAHRLDLETSGCLILAKKRSVLKELHELLRENQVTKIYLTLTKGQWTKNELRVDAPLRKNQLSGGERIVRVDKTGKPSLTVFEPLQSYKNAMLMEVTLHTGRTHQIRVHAQYRNHPLAGDSKYGDKDFNKEMRSYGLKRLFLHSHKLEFTLPSTGQQIKVTAPLEEDLQACLDNMTN